MKLLAFMVFVCAAQLLTLSTFNQIHTQTQLAFSALPSENVVVPIVADSQRITSSINNTGASFSKESLRRF